MGWKVVRDNDEKVCKDIGISGQWRPSKYPISGLVKKLFEEAAEFQEEYDPSELYDLSDVTEELIRRLDPDGIKKQEHLEKVRKRGLFTDCIEWCPVPNEQ